MRSEVTLIGRINLAHIRDSSGLYGAEQVILALAQHVDHKRFNFLLVCLQDKEGSAQPLIQRAKELGIQVEVVAVSSTFDGNAVKALRTILRDRTIHILHTHDFKSTLYGMLSSINMSVKRVATVHGSVKHSFKIRTSLFLEEQILRYMFDRAIAVAEDIQLQLRRKGFREEQVRLIPNGIDLSLFDSQLPTVGKQDSRGVNKGAPVFGVVGRLVSDKGHVVFLNALARIKQNHRKVRALIVGSGPLREEIQNEIRHLGLEESVVLCGVRDDMPAVYRQIDCIVIPSLREGLPYVLLEAMANKIPVVASRVGDIPRLIWHGETGYLVPPENVDELQKHMMMVLENPDLSAKLAESGYRLVREGFSATRMVKEVEGVYELLMRGTSGPKV
jgi:glycosyltransferase involved in cell wall biosynthesis